MKVSAYEVASTEANFGTNGDKAAAWLREMADHIEKRQFVLMGCTVLTRAKPEDYPTTFVRLQFYERRDGKIT